ncbi:MAG: FMN-binding protein [Candidatus Eisenbacteria bacterium]
MELLCPRAESGALLGYALVDEEVGKYRPITFLVGTDADLSVKGVEVLVYRESRGGEVQKARFLRQYRGKVADDPIRINKDILNIAGATLSVRALNLGVRRVLVSLEMLSERGALPTP